jgi:NAD(P)H-hydrate epimerase
VSGSGSRILPEALVSAESAAALDREASASWGLNPFALVEAAGRSCAEALGPLLRRGEKLLACAGPGNNGADALVMLRGLLMRDPSLAAGAAALLSRFPGEGEQSPRSAAVQALGAMGVPVLSWKGDDAAVRDASLIIDGIAGTGIRGPLEGSPLEMVQALAAAGDKDRIVSIDIPSGAGEQWRPGFPVVDAGCTLAVEPVKAALYTPALRPRCGTIIPVRGIFPPALLGRYRDADLLAWETMGGAVPPAPPDAYKYIRGVVEIHAGSSGFAGAARLAAAGASAAGAGLIRLVADDELYPPLASAAGGIMVVPLSQAGKKPGPCDAVLLGPGWGRKGREETLAGALEAEQAGTPLVLDADGIGLLKTLSAETGDVAFHRRAILTPHGGELEALSGIPKDRLLSEPARIRDLARQYQGLILFKSHVMVLADPGGRIGFVDGMNPALGAGGSGDFLAGLCAAIAGRLRAAERRGGESFDPYAAAGAAAALLAAAAKARGPVFFDPLELAGTAAGLAGNAWLGAPGWRRP